MVYLTIWTGARMPLLISRASKGIKCSYPKKTSTSENDDDDEFEESISEFTSSVYFIIHLLYLKKKDFILNARKRTQISPLPPHI